LCLNSKILKKLPKIFFTLLAITIPFYCYASIRVTKATTNDDHEITKLLNIDKECSNPNTYQKEIICIKSIQQSQLNLIEDTNCRGKFINLGSLEVINKNSACCFDRSRITEQALQIYGFKVRHVHLNLTDKRGFFNLLVSGSDSHAVTEVLTSKGWLGVDSNEPFILQDKDNFPNTYKQAIHNGVINMHTDNHFYKKPLTYVIGLYSRNGTFFQPYLPFVPEINIKDFFGNFFNITIINPIIKV